MTPPKTGLLSLPDEILLIVAAFLAHPAVTRETVMIKNDSLFERVSALSAVPEDLIRFSGTCRDLRWVFQTAMRRAVSMVGDDMGKRFEETIRTLEKREIRRQSIRFLRYGLSNSENLVISGAMTEKIFRAFASIQTLDLKNVPLSQETICSISCMEKLTTLLVRCPPPFEARDPDDEDWKRMPKVLTLSLELDNADCCSSVVPLLRSVNENLTELSVMGSGDAAPGGSEDLIDVLELTEISFPNLRAISINSLDYDAHSLKELIFHNKKSIESLELDFAGTACHVRSSWLIRVLRNLAGENVEPLFTAEDMDKFDSEELKLYEEDGKWGSRYIETCTCMFRTCGPQRSDDGDKPASEGSGEQDTRKVLTGLKLYFTSNNTDMGALNKGMKITDMRDMLNMPFFRTIETLSLETSGEFTPTETLWELHGDVVDMCRENLPDLEELSVSWGGGHRLRWSPKEKGYPSPPLPPSPPPPPPPASVDVLKLTKRNPQNKRKFDGGNILNTEEVRKRASIDKRSH